MTNKTDVEFNKSLIEYENMEKQLEMLLIQKHQLQLQINEIKHALEQLGKSQGTVYRSVGSVMMLSDKDDAKKDLSERQELIDVKLNAISKQEEKLRGSVAEAQKLLQERMKTYGRK